MRGASFCFYFAVLILEHSSDILDCSLFARAPRGRNIFVLFFDSHHFSFSLAPTGLIKGRNRVTIHRVYVRVRVRVLIPTDS